MSDNISTTPDTKMILSIYAPKKKAKLPHNFHKKAQEKVIQNANFKANSAISSFINQLTLDPKNHPHILNNRQPITKQPPFN